MAEITASLVKDLREKTGAGMMDCKRALAETNGNLEEAVDWLRKKGLSAAAKKSTRTAAEGLVGVFVKDNKGAIIELNAETDFVARNEKFQILVKEITKIAYEQDGDISQITAAKYPLTGKTVADEITESIAVIGENMNLRKASCIKVSNGVVAQYAHNTVAEGLGKIGVIVGLESSGNKEKLLELGKRIAMHIAASKPESLDIENVSLASIQKEKDIFAEQARNSGKTDDIIEKMVEGRIRKYYTEVVLLEQLFVMDNKTKISEVLKQAENEVGAPIRISSFVRFELGEGIEVEQTNFADEVAAINKK
jgi:elongation factor Ts